MSHHPGVVPAPHAMIVMWTDLDALQRRPEQAACCKTLKEAAEDRWKWPQWRLCARRNPCVQLDKQRLVHACCLEDGHTEMAQRQRAETTQGFRLTRKACESPEIILVPGGGIEPPRPCGRRILSPKFFIQANSRQ
ncbi:MAG: hypothetical protein Q7U56_05365 [Humidesulfovibrio sp.]|nr:hypothetical protein [Humidesulfovibrio sp.]